MPKGLIGGQEKIEREIRGAPSFVRGKLVISTSSGVVIRSLLSLVIEHIAMCAWRLHKMGCIHGDATNKCSGSLRPISTNGIRHLKFQIGHITNTEFGNSQRTLVANKAAREGCQGKQGEAGGRGEKAIEKQQN